MYTSFAIVTRIWFFYQVPSLIFKFDVISKPSVGFHKLNPLEFATSLDLHWPSSTPLLIATTDLCSLSSLSNLLMNLHNYFPCLVMLSLHLYKHETGMSYYFLPIESHTFFNLVFAFVT